ncbi:MAG: hypothetical protein ACK5OB_20015 [Pirellula sp.]
MSHRLNQQALVSLACDNGFTTITTAHPCVAGIESQATFLLLRSMTALAMIDQYRSHAFFEKVVIAFRTAIGNNEKEACRYASNDALRRYFFVATHRMPHTDRLSNVVFTISISSLSTVPPLA